MHIINRMLCCVVKDTNIVISIVILLGGPLDLEHFFNEFDQTNKTKQNNKSRNLNCMIMICSGSHCFKAQRTGL